VPGPAAHDAVRPAVLVEDVHKRFGDVQALDGVSFVRLRYELIDQRWSRQRLWP
jgi:hypothetical protein